MLRLRDVVPGIVIGEVDPGSDAVHSALGLAEGFGGGGVQRAVLVLVHQQRPTPEDRRDAANPSAGSNTPYVHDASHP